MSNSSSSAAMTFATTAATIRMSAPPSNQVLKQPLTAGAVKNLVCRDGTTVTTGTSSSTTTKANVSYNVIMYPYTIRVSGSNPDLGRVYVANGNDMYIYDGQHYVHVRLVDPTILQGQWGTYGTQLDRLKISMTLIRIKSFVTSSANLKQTDPIVYITSMEIVQEVCRLALYTEVCSRSVDSAINGLLFDQTGKGALPPGKPYELTEGRVMGNKLVTFLNNVVPYLSYDSISGLMHQPITPYIPSKAVDEYLYKTRSGGHLKVLQPLETKLISNAQQSYDETTRKLQLIYNFLSNHHAMDILAKASERTANEVVETGKSIVPLPTSIVLHFSVLKTFGLEQLERQKAAIIANIARTNQTPTTNKIIQQNQDTLTEIISPEFKINNVHAKDDITVGLLQYIHLKLCGNGLVPDAGQFRSRNVRVGTTNFVHDGNMYGTVSKLILSLQNLRARLPNVSIQQQLRNRNGIQQMDESMKTDSNGRTVELTQLLASLTYAAAVCIGVLDTHPYSDGNGRLARILLNYVLYHQVQIPFTIPLFATPAQRTEYTKAICKTRQNISLHSIGDVPDELLLASYEYCGALQPMVELIIDRIYKAISEFNKLVDEKLHTHSEEEESRSARNLRERTINSGDCQICLEGTPNISSLCCGTSYHMSCLARWLKSNSTCPKCRREIPRLETSDEGTTSTSGSELRRAVEVIRDQMNISGNLDAWHDDTIQYGLMDAIEEALRDGSEDGEHDTEEDDTEEDNTEMSAEDETVDDTTNGNPECAHCSNLAARNCCFNCCARCCRNIYESNCVRHS